MKTRKKKTSGKISLYIPYVYDYPFPIIESFADIIKVWFALYAQISM